MNNWGLMFILRCIFTYYCIMGRIIWSRPSHTDARYTLLISFVQFWSRAIIREFCSIWAKLLTRHLIKFSNYNKIFFIYQSIYVKIFDPNSNALHWFSELMSLNSRKVVVSTMWLMHFVHGKNGFCWSI